jgi:hypothetical protein
MNIRRLNYVISGVFFEEITLYVILYVSFHNIPGLLFSVKLS